MGRSGERKKKGKKEKKQRKKKKKEQIFGLLSSLLLATMEAVLALLPSNTTVIGQGAEAIVGQVTIFPGAGPSGSSFTLAREAVVKQRFSKAYRHPRLDTRITQQRVKDESKMMVKALKEGIDCPVLYHTDLARHRIFMEKIEGSTLKQYLLERHPISTQFPEEALRISREVGGLLARLHVCNIVHGDLTTSNLMVRAAPSGSLALIDFGLSYTSTLAEDKAVDLYVLERAFISTHPNSEDYVRIFSFFFFLGC